MPMYDTGVFRSGPPMHEHALQPPPPPLDSLSAVILVGAAVVDLCVTEMGIAGIYVEVDAEPGKSCRRTSTRRAQGRSEHAL